MRGEQSNKQDKEVLFLCQNIDIIVCPSHDFYFLTLTNNQLNLQFHSLLTFSRKILFSEKKELKNLISTQKHSHLLMKTLNRNVSHSLLQSLTQNALISLLMSHSHCLTALSSSLFLVLSWYNWAGPRSEKWRRRYMECLHYKLRKASPASLNYLGLLLNHSAEIENYWEKKIKLWRSL